MTIHQSWKEAFSTAADELATVISTYSSRQAVKDLRPILPYAIIEVGDGKYIPVNRDYKPLGVSTDEWVEYGEYPWLHIEADEPIAARGSFWLFNDACPPWKFQGNAKGAKWRAERLLRLIKLLLSPDLDLMDTRMGSTAFQLLVGDRDNRKSWGLEGMHSFGGYWFMGKKATRKIKLSDRLANRSDKNQQEGMS